MTTQLDSSIGLGEESTYATPVTVTRFVEFIGETFDVANEWSGTAGVRVGSRAPRADRRALTQTGAAGSLTVEAATKGLGILLKAALGSVTTNLVETGVYQQVHTPLTSDPAPSFTVQKGIPPIGGGATHAMTFPGCVCKSIEVSAKLGSPVEVATDWIGASVDTATAYASPSYPSSLDVLTFVHGAIVLGGTLTEPTTTALASSTASPAANVMSATVKVETGIDEGGRALGGGGAITRRPTLGKLTISGQLEVEYTDDTLRDASLDGTQLALVLTFTHPDLIGATATAALQVVVPVIAFASKLPQASTDGTPVKTTMDYTGLDDPDTYAAPIFAVYVSTDATP